MYDAFLQDNRLVRAHLLYCSMDEPAQKKTSCFLHHNGWKSCERCLIEGIKSEKNKMIYYPPIKSYPLRTHLQVIIEKLSIYLL